MGSYPRYAPDYALRIDDAPIPAALRGSIASLTYEDGIDGADRVEISIANPSLAWLDHPLLSVDQPLSLSIGYAGEPLEEIFTGEITGVQPSFPAGGMPTITVTAHDFLQRLTHGTKDRGFRISLPSIGNFPLPDPVVAGIVSATNALIPNIDPIGGALSTLISLATFLTFPQFAQKSVRQQYAESDFDLLKRVARENGWEMYIDHSAEPKGRMLRFQFLLQDYSASLELDWGSSLIEFTPRLTTVGDIFGISARVWVDSIGIEFVIIVSWDYDRAAIDLQIYPNLIGDIDDILGPEKAKKTISVKPTGYATAPRKILGELLPRLNNRQTGRGSAVGDPRIKSTKVVRLGGLGSQFGGLYRITSATHTFDSSGYRTSFEARKEVWFGSIPLPFASPTYRPLTGQFAR
jgi:phage protein D